MKPTMIKVNLEQLLDYVAKRAISNEYQRLSQSETIGRFSKKPDHNTIPEELKEEEREKRRGPLGQWVPFKGMGK